MSYTVIGLFTNKVETDKALSKLENAGYYDYTISHSHEEILENVDVEKKNGFWNWLFDNNHVEKERYQYASIDSNTISVFTETEDEAHIAKDILDRNGAINVEEKTRDFILDKFPDSHQKFQISDANQSRIIAKAKNNLFFTNERKPHHIHEKRIAGEIDGQGDRI